MAANFLPHLERLEAVAISQAGLIAVGGRRDGDAPTSVHVATLPKVESPISLETGEAVLALAFVGEVLCAGDSKGHIHLWDGAKKLKSLGSVQHHKGAIRALIAVGNQLGSVGDDGVFRLAKLTASGLGAASELALSKRSLRAITFDAGAGDEDLGAVAVAVGGDDGIVRSFFAKADGAPREMDMGAAVTALAFLGDGRIAAGCADGSLRFAFLEGAAEPEERSKDAAHEGAIRSLIYSAQLYDVAKRPLGRRLLSVAEDGDIKAWQVDSKRKPPTLKVSQKALTGAVLIPGNPKAKGDKRGGTLAVVDRRRTLSLLTVDQEGKVSDSISRVQSRFEELAGLVKSRKDDVRIGALSDLGKLAEDEARKQLDATLLGDNKPAVRRAAAAAIGSSDRRLSRPALRQALSDSDPKVRDASLRALEKIEHETPVAAARAALGSSKSDIRIAGVRRLPALRAQSSLVPALIAQTLSDDSEKVRAAALDALYSLESDASLDAARIALGRGPADVRRDVLIRIGQGRLALLPEGAEIIEGALDDEDESVRSTAFLTSIAARASLMAKVRSVDAHTKKAVADLESRGLFADASDATDIVEADLRPLFAAMACRFADTALRAARLLGMLGDPRASGVLLQLSREPEPSTRRYVIEALMSAALAMPSDGRVTARLRWLIDDVDSTVRQAAFDVVQMLGEVGGAASEIDVAALALRAGNADIRVRALQILVKFGGSGQYAKLSDLAEQADLLLGDALDDEHDKVRGEAFRTLWAWHNKDPRRVLERAALCRQPEVRRRVIKELPHQKPDKNAWADALMLSLIADHSSAVGVDAYEAAVKPKDGAKRVDVHQQALNSPCADVRVLGLRGAPKKNSEELVPRMVELVRDDKPAVHIAAIEALDRVSPKSAEGFALAFASIFYELRVRAMELCGRRRDERCIVPAKEFLAIVETDINRPSDALRARAAAALADVGARSLLGYYQSLLEDGNPGVREMASRGMATAAAPGDESMLSSVLGHEDLPVRSWVAEGLARLGDVRALPVLAGTLAHDHLPIRRGAIMGFVALGPDGVGGLLKGLDDRERTIQDLVFAVIVARDLALSKAGEGADLLLSALSAQHPEIRYAAAQLLEVRGTEAHTKAAAALVGPQLLEKASEMKDWPTAEEQATRLAVLVDALASDHPLHRYAATQVLALRPQAKAFWRESKLLLGPSSKSRPRIPFTNWDSEDRLPRKRSWIHELFRKASQATSTGNTETERLLQVLGVVPSSVAETRFEESKLVFGTYAGLVRSAPVHGESDESHRVRRDSVQRLAVIASDPAVGLEAVMPVLRSGLSDPHHMVRRSAVAAIRSLYPQGSLEPLRFELSSSASDVGRGGVNEVVSRAAESAEALALAKETINAPVAEVRRFGLSQLPQLFETGSTEPWLLALESRYSDIRINVVDRLVDSTDERVLVALGRAMESEHEDLRLRAASALAARGDVRTADVLTGLLFSEDWEDEAIDALIELAHARNNPEAKRAAALALVHRLENDPDETASRYGLFSALARVGDASAAEFLTKTILDEESRDDSSSALGILVQCLTLSDAPIVRDTNGGKVPAFDASIALPIAAQLVASKDVGIRQSTTEQLLRYLPGQAAEELLDVLLQDRVAEVRVAACLALAYRAANTPEANIGALSSALREGRRELVLPAAEGLAARQQPEAFQPLLLVFKAGEQQERARAVIAMGALGDSRVLEELLPFVEGANDLEPEDAELVPAIVESLGRMLPRLKEAVATKVRGLVENLAREGGHDLRIRALCGLRHAGDKRSLAFIEGVAADSLEGSAIRVAAIGELGALANPSSETVLADIVAEGGYNTGYAALEALKKIFPDDKTRTQLMALRSADSNLSAPAASYLSWFGEVETLMDQLSSVTDQGIRARLRQGLIRRELSDTAALEARLGDMLASKVALDRADASWVVGAAKIDNLATGLSKALSIAAKEYSEASTVAQEDHCLEAWTAGLWAALQISADADKAAKAALEASELPGQLRVMAARVIAAGKGDQKLLESLLTDRQASVRTTAASALAALFPKKVEAALTKTIVADGAALRPVIQAAIEGGSDLLTDSTTRRLATSTMMGRRRVGDFTKVAQTSKDKTARLAAIAALGRMGGGEAEEALTGLVKEEAAADEVKAASYRALRRLQRRAAKLASYEESR
tara:strand:+ start:97542 stop:104081 length:6540 start_codon:yes stop_codon:yes gene_type:complete